MRMHTPGLSVLIATLLSVAGHGVLSKDILVLLPFPGYSHTMPFMPIFKELGRRGHNVTMVTPFPQEPTPKGFNQITVPTNVSSFTKYFWSKFGGTPKPGSSNMNPLMQLFGISMVCPVLTTYVMELAAPLLPPPETSNFDLVITEPFFCMEPLLAAGHLYKAPIVATMPATLNPTAAKALGNPTELSYVPTGRAPYTDKMSFLQRTWSTFCATFDQFVTYIYHYPTQDKYMRQYIPFKGIPYIEDLVRNISMIFTLTHSSMNYPRPYARNVLEVAGVSTAKVSPLPQDLEEFVSGAKDGVILFSWGSHYEAEGVDDILHTLMTTFAKIKQRVLFKWANTSLPNIPENVLVRKWLPQPSILAHNKTVAFISHCGMNSMYEAAYFGVPVVGTALFGDQIFNIRMLEDFGMAINLDVTLLKTQGSQLLDAITEITQNPSYKANAVRRSVLMSDRPMPPLEEAVYWIEYIMRNGGDHLQPQAKNMPWYSLALIDVWVFVLTITAAILYLLWKSVRITIALCCKRRSKTNPDNEKKNK